MQSPTLMEILAYVYRAVVATGIDLFILMGTGLILGFIIHKLSRAILAHAGSMFPVCFYARLFLIPGLALHEFSHLAFSKLFGFQVYEVVFFQCKPGNPYGGYVKRSVPKNFIQRIGGLFIGIAPIIFGTLAIYVLSYLLLGPGLFAGVSSALVFDGTPDLLTLFGQLYESVVIMTMRVFVQLVSLIGTANWQVWLFLYLAYSLSNAMNLTPSDLLSMTSGLKTLAVVLLIVNLVAMAGGEDALRPYVVQLSRMYSGFYAIMLFALSLNLLAAIVVVPLGTVFRRS